MKPGRGRPPIVTCIAACLLVVALSGGAARAQTRLPWWNGRWPMRTVFTLEGGPAAARSGAHLWLHLPADLIGDGRDLRIIDPDGRELPFDIVTSTPEGRFLLAFKPTRPQGAYAVYFGNPHASPGARAAPKAGLLHSTYALPEGAETGSWDSARKALAAAGPPQGVDFWPQVFDGYNPFGPQRDYIASYRGYFRCPAEGEYAFATVSDNSSFLLVDGRPVTQWPGPHNIRRGLMGEQSGTVRLESGVHSLWYVHFAHRGPARCVAAWKPPGESHFVVMPPEAFVPIARGRIRETQAMGRPASADFTWSARSYCEAGEAQMVEIDFTSTASVSGGALIESYAWDFGDGQFSDASQPRHVYLAPGVYDAAFRVVSTSGAADTCTKRVKVEPEWNDMNFTLRKVTRFMDGVRDYRLKALPTSCLLGAWHLYRETDEDSPAIEAAMLLHERRDELDPNDLYEVAMELARHYQTGPTDPDRAEELLKEALEAAGESGTGRRVRAAFALCDHYFHQTDDPARARREYTRLRAEYLTADPDIRRRALIRIGDTYRAEGNAEEALRVYREAESDPAYSIDKPRALVTGAITHEVESYLMAGNAEEALKRLDELIWYYPTMQLEGETALLRTRALLVEQHFRAARREANTYIRIGRDPDYLPAVHVQAADACTELGLVDEAIAHYRKVIDGFPESPRVHEARSALVRLGG